MKGVREVLRLPTAPLYELIREVGMERASEALAAERGCEVTSAYQALRRLFKQDTIGVMEGDAIACALGVHPVQVWGDEFWKEAEAS